MVVQVVPAPNDATDARQAFSHVSDVPNDNMFTVDLDAV